MSVDNLPLFDITPPPTYPKAPGFKAHGTSQEAAQSVDVATLRANVLKALRRHGPMTADACAARLRRSVLSIRPRFSELRALGQIVDSGVRSKNESGHRAIVWRVA